LILVFNDQDQKIAAFGSSYRERISNLLAKAEGLDFSV